MINKLFILTTSLKFTVVNFNIINIFAKKYLMKSNLFYIIDFLDELFIKKIEIFEH